MAIHHWVGKTRLHTLFYLSFLLSLNMSQWSSWSLPRSEKYFLFTYHVNQLCLFFKYRWSPALVCFDRQMIQLKRTHFLFSSFFHLWLVTFPCLSHRGYQFTGLFSININNFSEAINLIHVLYVQFVPVLGLHFWWHVLDLWKLFDIIFLLRAIGSHTLIVYTK